jgi:uncharacterized membrane protein
MALNRTPVAVLVLVAALAAAQLVHYHPQLPDTIAVHFNASGEPDGWSGKTEFVLTYGAIEALMVLMGVAAVLIIGRVPPALVNIPNREYWLAPERRAETVEFIAGQVVWIEIATLGFLMAIAQLIFIENLGGDAPRLSGDFWYVLVAFVCVVLWIGARIILRFRVRG